MNKTSQLLSLYKSMLRESQKFSNYNVRTYALRRVRDGFKGNKNLNCPEKIEDQLQLAQSSLNLIKRQVLVSGMYQTYKLVIEN